MRKGGAFVGLLWVESWRGEPIDEGEDFFFGVERGIRGVKKRGERGSEEETGHVSEERGRTYFRVA